MSQVKADYSFLLNTASSEQWKRIGVGRRAGVCIPLFSVYSSSSIGIGEFPDLKLVVDWCNKSGMSIIQLLPLNDVGFNFRPYDSLSSFAIDPMYLSISLLKHVDRDLCRNEIENLRKAFSALEGLVDYSIKGKKLEILWKIYEAAFNPEDKDFIEFKTKNAFWLEDYSVFKTIRYLHGEKCWDDWPEELRLKNKKAVDDIKAEHKKAVVFQEWLQWQCSEQLIEAKQYALSKGVYIMGDMPFLVSRESADVWSNPQYFKLNYAAGAPPDDFNICGQRWGMPPYDWAEIKRTGYEYLKQKLQSQEKYFDLFRLDHAIGVFRIWIVSLEEPCENAGKNGIFDPENEKEWESHGLAILEEILGETSMLPCAEDLGAIPDCSPGVLKKLGLPGMDIQRWMHKNHKLLEPEDYRPISLAAISTHDMMPLRPWWASLGDKDKRDFAEYFDIEVDCTIEDMAEKALLKAGSSQSIFSIHLMHDWLALDSNLQDNAFTPINLPGSMDASNWRWRIPMSLEALNAADINTKIAFINNSSDRS